LNNDVKYKELATKVEAKYGDSKVDLNDLYACDYKAQGPWRSITE